MIYTSDDPIWNRPEPPFLWSRVNLQLFPPQRRMRKLIKRSKDKLDLPLKIERAIRPSTRRRGIWTVRHLSIPEHVPPPGSPPRSCRSAVDAPAASFSRLCRNIRGAVACGQRHLSFHMIEHNGTCVNELRLLDTQFSLR